MNSNLELFLGKTIPILLDVVDPKNGIQIWFEKTSGVGCTTFLSYLSRFHPIFSQIYPDKIWIKSV